MPASHEHATLHELYSVDSAEGLPPYTRKLYPRFLRYWQYLGTGTSLCRWNDPGYTYVPAEDLIDSPLNYEFKFVQPTEKLEVIPDVRTALYRLRDDLGRLLYVGISSNPLRRWPEHAAAKSWWPDVTDLSMQWFKTRTAALEAEAAAIRRERPLHNVAHNLPRLSEADPANSHTPPTGER